MRAKLEARALDEGYVDIISMEEMQLMTTLQLRHFYFPLFFFLQEGQF